MSGPSPASRPRSDGAMVATSSAAAAGSSATRRGARPSPSTRMPLRDSSALHGGHDELAAIGDLVDRVARDDDAVVAHERDARGGLAGARLEGRPQVADGARQRQARVRVGHPEGLVAEDARRDGLAVLVAGHAVGDDGVRVEHEALRQERVEEQLHRGPAALGLGQPGLRGHAHDRVGLALEAGLGLRTGAAVEQVEQRRHLERHEVVRLERGQRHAAGLDVDDAVGLHRGVAAAAARVLRVPPEALRHLDGVDDDLVGEVEQVPGLPAGFGHRDASVMASTRTCSPSSAK